MTHTLIMMLSTLLATGKAQTRVAADYLYRDGASTGDGSGLSLDPLEQPEMPTIPHSVTGTVSYTE